MSREEDNPLLAIIIPAYKAKYLSETLDSVASQTDKRFCVYIGDDNSPEDIESIVSQYYGQFNYIYKRFEDNLGGKDLVAQWERCIDMTGNEPWIWLFSDDDYMDKTCVENFYRLIQNNHVSELLRFNVNIVDSKKNIIKTCSFPKNASSSYLFKNKLRGDISVFAVEFIFSRKVYKEKSGFQKFDLAWGSDTATWTKFAEKGIMTIPSSFVSWRKSDENITGRADTMEGLLRKFKASNHFLVWSRQYWKEKNCNYNSFVDFIFVRRLHEITRYVSKDRCFEAAGIYWGNSRLRKIKLKTFFHIYNFLSNIKKRL